MRLLLDSHTLLWGLDDNPRLGPYAREAIRSPDNEVFVSAASVWELAMKRASGRLDAPDNLVGACGEQGFALIPIEPFHAEQLDGFPPTPQGGCRVGLRRRRILSRAFIGHPLRLDAREEGGIHGDLRHHLGLDPQTEFLQFLGEQEAVDEVYGRSAVPRGLCSGVAGEAAGGD